MSKRLREWRLSRARAARADKPAAPDPPAPDPELIEKFAKEAHDLDAARKSVEDAASVTTGLWLSYLFVLVYIGIAAGAVRHRDLLLENPVRLPFLSDVPLPLIAFFVLAPIVFIVSHAYTLVHFVMLAAKVGVFKNELGQLGNATETKECLRWQLPPNIFVQILAGPEDIRKGRLGFLSKLIAWISLVIGPVLLLLLVQVQFLPYHSSGVTWVHRSAVLADLILLWALWPAVVDSGSKLKWPRPWRQKGLVLATLVAIGLAFTAATFPGEWLEDWIGKRQSIPPFLAAWLVEKDDKDLVKDAKDQPAWTSFHDLLFNGEYDERSQRRKSLFSNTLVLPGFDALEAAKIDDPKKLDAVKQTFTRKNGHLESAVFRGADLRKANLENAHLQGADLYQAKLQGARFYNANLQGAALYQAKLQSASLADAQLQGAWLEGAELQGAFADASHLQGASLKGAKLQGASLKGAKLQGVSLKCAEFQGADFQKTTLAGTDMRGAAVWRANFDDALLSAVSEDGMKERAISKEAFAELQATIKEAPEGEDRTNALGRIGKLNPDGNEASAREVLEEGRVDETAYKESLADQLKSLACSGDEDALHIVRGLIANERIKDTGAQAPGLVEAILKPDCPVSAALTDADKAALEKLKKEASGAP